MNRCFRRFNELLATQIDRIKLIISSCLCHRDVMLLLKQVLTTLTYLHNKKPGPESRLLEDEFFSYGYLDTVFCDRVRVQQLIKSTVRLAAQKLSNPARHQHHFKMAATMVELQGLTGAKPELTISLLN